MARKKRRGFYAPVELHVTKGKRSGLKLAIVLPTHEIERLLRYIKRAIKK
jgi:hypothetical protein